MLTRVCLHTPVFAPAEVDVFNDDGLEPAADGVDAVLARKPAAKKQKQQRQAQQEEVLGARMP